MAIPEAKTDHEQALLTVIKRRDRMGVVEFLSSLEPKERRALNKYARRYVSALKRDFSMTRWKSTDAALLAVLATSTPSEVSKRSDVVDLGRSFLKPDELNPLMRLIEALRPDWADAFVDRLLSNEFGSWVLAFEIYRRGLCQRPVNDQFRLRLFGDAAAYPPDHNSNRLDFVLANAELLAPEIYDAFALPQIEDVSKWDLELQVWPNASELQKENVRKSDWRLILSTLCERGLMDRERLIGNVFGALAIVQKKPIVKWLSGLIEHLAGDHLERWIEHDGELGLIPLLGSSNSSVVNWALKKISALQKSGALDPKLLLENITPVLSQESKTTVISAIKLLKRTVKKHHDLHPESCLTVLDALVHPEASVHQEAAKFLAAYATTDDPELRLKLLDYSATIAPSARSEFGDWLLDCELEIAEPIDADLRDPEPVLSDSRRIEPIAHIDDLIERLSYFWQEQSDIAEMNRVLDALGRFAEGAADLPQRSAAFLKLADGAGTFFGYGSRLLNEFIELPVQWIKALPKSWFGRIVDGIGGQLSSQRGSLFRQFSQPMKEALSSRQVYELLSTPTHEGSWIDPLTLVERLRRFESEGRRVWPLDAAIAFLRLPDVQRAEALSAASSLSTEVGRALRYALGEELAIGDDQLLWTAAARSRDPGGHHDALGKRFPSNAPDASVPAEYRLQFKAAEKKPNRWNKELMDISPAEVRAETMPPRGEVDPGMLPEGLHTIFPNLKGGWIDYWSVDYTNIFWCASIWPRNLDPILGQAVRYLALARNDGNKTLATEFCGPLFARLREPAQPFSELGYHVTALGLGAAERGARAAAVDLVIANLEYRWFEPARLGDSLARMLNGDCLHLNRLLESFKEICAVGPLHSNRAVEAIGHSLDLDLSEPPRLLNKWLEFLVERRPADHVLPESARAWLEQLPKNGVLGRTLKKLL